MAAATPSASGIRTIKTQRVPSKRPPIPRAEDASAPSKATPPPDCDPPYSVDATGHKRFKLECVGGK